MPPGSRQALNIRVTNNTAEAQPVTVALAGPESSRADPASHSERLEPARAETLTTAITVPRGAEVQEFTVRVAWAGATVSQTRYLRTLPAEGQLMSLREQSIPVFPGMALRGQQERELDTTTGASFRAERLQCGGVERDGFFCHPPYKGGVGYAFGAFALRLPDEPIALRFYTGLRDGSTSQDGVLFKVVLLDERGVEHELFSRVWEQQRWGEWRVDLSGFRGQRVRLKLICDVGPNDNSNSDWACWGDVAVVAAEPRVMVEMLEKPPG